MEMDITLRRTLLHIGIIGCALYTIPVTRPIIASLFDYTIIGFITPGLIFGLAAVGYVILKYRREI